MTNFEYYKDEILKIAEQERRSFALCNNKLTVCSLSNCDHCNFDKDDNYDCGVEMMKWLYAEHVEQPNKLTKKERQFCELVETGWIARDSTDELWWFKFRPNKNPDQYWGSGGATNYISNFPCKFSFITWNDKDPWSIEDLLKLKTEE